MLSLTPKQGRMTDAKQVEGGEGSQPGTGEQQVGVRGVTQGRWQHFASWLAKIQQSFIGDSKTINHTYTKEILPHCSSGQRHCSLSTNINKMKWQAIGWIMI